MARRWQMVLGLVTAGLVGAAPVVYSSHRTAHVRNFRVVEEGVLYRSGQLTPEGLDRVIRERGIRSVVSLRAARRENDPHPDAWESEFCHARGVQHFRIIPRVWTPDKQGEVPASETVRQFLEDVMDHRENYPVLVHCFAGIHRTGTLCAIFRMEYNRWPAERAINEMQLCGFEPEDMVENIDGYLRKYDPRWNRSGR